ncbi:VIT1/CCC1 transporter family protein [Halobaculum roseum]|uniref:VIT1/CCC1 transporter family protein n=1 Tax=Halobaculum roseum TaxID=2175149 RepID=A0ABD5MVM3_9EURY|nr:VIT1/CCC1 transporter family protein [Halobaculum roseum]QZY04558.1 VIT1/CCC1 transporter family protein [Halobaculum roseum]
MIEQLLGDEIKSSGRYLAEVIYGANDGIVTTFAVVSGVAGAALNPSIVLVLGAANLFADGFSMGMSNYLSRRSELDYERSRPAFSPERPPDTHDGKPPYRTAAVTFLAFVSAGWAPLFPYIIGVAPAFRTSVAFTGAAFFIVGASRSLVTARPWYRNGAEMLAVGMAAAGVAFGVGRALSGLA